MSVSVEGWLPALVSNNRFFTPCSKCSDCHSARESSLNYWDIDTKEELCSICLQKEPRENVLQVRFGGLGRGQIHSRYFLIHFSFYGILNMRIIVVYRFVDHRIMMSSRWPISSEWQTFLTFSRMWSMDPRYYSSGGDHSQDHQRGLLGPLSVLSAQDTCRTSTCTVLYSARWMVTVEWCWRMVSIRHQAGMACLARQWHTAAWGNLCSILLAAKATIKASLCYRSAGKVCRSVLQCCRINHGVWMNLEVLWKSLNGVLSKNHLSPIGWFDGLSEV